MPHRPDIRFGTDGWRAIIGDDYTFDNVRACAQAVALEVEASGQSHRGIAVGYDTRFQSKNFAQATAEVIANHGITVQISDRPLPTPALSLAVTTIKAAAGVMITASHNSHEYNGFKVKSESGGSAPPEQVERIEALLDFPPLAKKISEGQEGSNTEGVEPNSSSAWEKSMARGSIQSVDMVTPYLVQLSRFVDIELIKSAGIRIAVDSMHGSGAGIIVALLEGGATQVSEIRGDINPAFPSMKQPEPIEENLEPLITKINQNSYDVGIATDGDADRLGVVAETGQYITTLEVFSMLFHHLKSRRNLPGGVACTITMSSMIDRLAEYHNTPLFRTPVGFKFVGPAMIDNQCVLGGEESGGYAFAGHIPERDGPLSALYLLESMAISGKSPSKLLNEIRLITGPHTFRRIDIQFIPEQRQRIVSALATDSPTTLADIPVVNIDRCDGIRLDLQNGAWAVVRISGTEPLLRIYAEAHNTQNRDKIIQNLRQLLNV